MITVAPAAEGIRARTGDGQAYVDLEGHVRLAAEREADAQRAVVPARLDIRLLVPALAAWAVVAATLALPWHWRAIGACCGFVVAALAAWVGRPRHGRRRRQLLLGALTAGVATLTLAAAAAADAARRAGPLADWAQQGAVARIEATVLADPIDIGGGRYLIRVRAHRVAARGVLAETSARLLVIGDRRWSELSWHTGLSGLVRLGPGEPGSAELAVARVLGPPVIRQPRGTTGWTDHVRRALRSAVGSLPPDARGLVPAMVVGDTSRSPPELTADMRATGLTHLSAVSGANISILLVAVAPLVRLLRVPRRARPLVLGALVVAFVAVARPEPSVIRAAVMGGIGLLALYRSTRASGVAALATAIVVLLIVDPWLARSAGFALSVLATLGLLVFVRPWADALAPRVPVRLRPALPALLLPLAAQVACAPVIVVLQGNISVVGIPANLLAAALVGPVTIGGATVGLLAAVGVPTGPLAWAPGVPALGIAEIAHRGAGLPWAGAPWPAGATGAWLMTAVIVLALVCGPRLAYAVGSRPRRWVVAGLLVGALLLPTRPLSWPPPHWQFVACDVGQGDALVVRTGAHSAVLVDAGPDPRQLDRCLSRLRVDVVDLIVLTHFHADHIDGLPGALGGRRVGAILVSPVAEPRAGSLAVTDQARRAHLPVRALQVGEIVRAGPFVATVRWPQRRIPDGSVPNNASLVLDARVGELDLLLTGDIEREAGRAIAGAARADPVLRARLGAYDIVKLPHHGSANLDPGLLTMLRAPLMVVSVGADNDYGHPSPDALDWVRGTGARLERTDRDGDIAAWLDGGRLLVRSRS